LELVPESAGKRMIGVTMNTTRGRRRKRRKVTTKSRDVIAQKKRNVLMDNNTK
jgi:hypothetical protein